MLDLPENQEVVIIGTLYKEMKLKPSILAEYTKVPSFTSPSKHCRCWDDSEEVKSGRLNEQHLVLMNRREQPSSFK